MFNNHIQNCRAFEAPGKPSPEWFSGYNGLVRVAQLRIPRLAATWQPLLDKAVDERNAAKLEHDILEVNYKQLEKRYRTLSEVNTKNNQHMVELSSKVRELGAELRARRELLEEAEQDLERTRNEVIDREQQIKELGRDLKNVANRADDLSTTNANQATTIANLSLKVADLDAELKVARQSKVINEPMMMEPVKPSQHVAGMSALTLVIEGFILGQLVEERAAIKAAIWDHIVWSGKEEVKCKWLEEMIDARS